MPDGLIQPKYQARSTNRNTVMDKATRTARARAMAGLLEPGSEPLRSMNRPAPANAASTATSRITMTTFIWAEYFTRPGFVCGACAC